MRKIISLLITAFILITSNAYAEMTFEDGNKAYTAHNYAKAIKIYTPLALNGDAIAQSNLGFMYEHGQGVIQDYAEAVKWYKLAAVQGYAIAQSNLGVMYERGHGVTQDYIAAHMWYNLAAAKQGHVAEDNRDAIAKKMSADQVLQAQNLAKQCLASNYKNCYTTSFKSPTKKAPRVNS